MKRLVFLVLIVLVLIASPASLRAWAQVKLAPMNVTTRVHPCAPSGQTADHQLVYSLKCDSWPGPPPLPAEAEVAPPPPEPEIHRSGIFGLSYEAKRPDQ